MKKILMVIDYQNDFVAPEGVLSIPNAQNLSDFIQDRINDNSYEKVIYTMDTHTPIMYSCSEEQKLFPNIHCEYGTSGWNWFAIKPKNNFDMVKFSVPREVMSIENEVMFLKNEFNVWTGNSYFKNYMDKIDRDIQIDVVGVAFEYCVFYAVKGLIDNGFKNVNILMNGTEAISQEGKVQAEKDFKAMGVNLV